MEDFSTHRVSNLRAATDALTRLEEELAVASPRLKAGTMLLANHILRMAARIWGKSVVDDPRNSNVAIPVETMLANRDDAHNVMKWTGRYEANLRQCMALDVCIITLATGLNPLSLQRVSQIWRTLWSSHPHLTEALVNIRDWEVERGVSALPRDNNGDYPDDVDALSCGKGFPLYLRASVRRN